CEAPRLSRKIHLLLAKVQSFLAMHRNASTTLKSLGKVRPKGEAADAEPADDLCEPGPGVWPLRLAERQRGGERMTAAPAQTSLLAVDETSSSADQKIRRAGSRRRRSQRPS